MHDQTSRKKLHITGLIQGVGFRPFIFNLASRMGLRGWVANNCEGVTVDLEGTASALDAFVQELQASPTAISKIESLTVTSLPPCDYNSFELRPSETDSKPSMFISPDIATCPACREEIFDPQNRRYHYPFTSCSHCGPRFSIIEALPYDRIRTSMKVFPLCNPCQTEYENPSDRRFHAQSIACPDCGPAVELTDQKGRQIAVKDTAIKQAADALRTGSIIALKGIGGFQLLADASRQATVERLRQLKMRPDKPFAMMCRDIDQIETITQPTSLEKQLLLSPVAPIVLLDKNAGEIPVADAVAPGNTRLGIMLPCSPLHHLLLSYLSSPVVATSGNYSSEPICIDNLAALERLGKIADLILVHNRTILRPVDDSIVQVVYGREMVMRSARGYAPVTINIRDVGGDQQNVMAVGGHLKNTIALRNGDYAVISQHIGDLDNLETVLGFKQNISDLCDLFQYQPEHIVRDLHVDYASSQFAENLGLPVTTLQHHKAHLLSCMAEQRVEPPLLGIIWDGSGLGDNGSLWGGEFYTLQNNMFSHLATLRDFPLPGGTSAIKEPRRTALGMLWEIMGDNLYKDTWLAPVSAFKPGERILFQQMLSSQINSPRCSSIGRLFDCIASLLDLCQISSFEGQAAMLVEQALTGTASEDHYSLLWNEACEPVQFDWEPLLREIIADLQRAVPNGIIAARFHNTLSEMAAYIARISGLKRVVLSGGCFQNRHLTERIIRRLSEQGLDVYWHQKVPPNDGGLALGQLFAVSIGGTRTNNVFSDTR